MKPIKLIIGFTFLFQLSFSKSLKNDSIRKKNNFFQSSFFSLYEPTVIYFFQEENAVGSYDPGHYCSLAITRSFLKHNLYFGIPLGRGVEDMSVLQPRKETYRAKVGFQLGYSHLLLNSKKKLNITLGFESRYFPYRNTTTTRKLYYQYPQLSEIETKHYKYYSFHNEVKLGIQYRVSSSIKLFADLGGGIQSQKTYFSKEKMYLRNSLIHASGDVEYSNSIYGNPDYSVSLQVGIRINLSKE